MIESLRVSSYLLLTLANLFRAGNWVVSRAFRDELLPAALYFWRWVVALLCLLPPVLPHVRRDGSQLKAAWSRLLLFGALGTGGYMPSRPQVHPLSFLAAISITGLVFSGIWLNTRRPA